MFAEATGEVDWYFNGLLVPLSRQAVAILRSLHPLTGHGALVFPGERSHDRPISENSVWFS